MEKETKQIYSLMVMATLFWGGAFIAGKIGVKEIPPLSLTFFRFLAASLIIFFVMVKYEKKDWHLKKADWPVIILLGVVGMIGYHILFFAALKYTTAVNSSIIGATNPLITAILSVIFLGDKLTLKRLGAIFLAFFGVVLTITEGNFAAFHSFSFNIGDLLMLAAVLCWAVYTVISRQVMPRYSPLILTTYSFLVCTVLTFPFVLAIDRPWTYLPHTTWHGWSAVLYMAVFPSVMGYLIQQFSIKALGATKTMIFINLVPISSMAFAALILHEIITPYKVFSALIIITGVYLTTKL